MAVSSTLHNAEDAALGFRYQERYAILQLLELKDDDGAVAVESLDDIHIQVNGADFLTQLKHSLSEAPPPIHIKSASVWKTFRIWCDLLPTLNLNSTRFSLVTVAPIAAQSALNLLAIENSDRTSVLAELTKEALRVVEKVDAASTAGKDPPYKDRSPGAKAFLGLSENQREALVKRISLKPGAPDIIEIEGELAKQLDTYPRTQRELLAAKICEWWDRQVMLSMCNVRPRSIKRFELIEQLSEISAALTTEALMESFSSKLPAEMFHTEEMLIQQCNLVRASTSMVKKARISEWQARNQRSAWAAEAPSKLSKVAEFDQRLIIEWGYQHEPICEPDKLGNESDMVENGLAVLRWTLEAAPQQVGCIEATVTSPFYVRGTYQILSIDGSVGWHPDYKARLGFK